MFLLRTAVYAVESPIQTSLQSKHVFTQPDLIDVLNYPSRAVEYSSFLMVNSGHQSDVDPAKRTYGLVNYRFQQDQSIIFQLGVPIDLIDDSRKNFNLYNSTTFAITENNIGLTYVIKDKGVSYALGYLFADYKDKVNFIDNTAGVINAGLRFSDFSLGINWGLNNAVYTTSNEYLQFDQSVSVTSVLEMDTLQIQLDMISTEAKNVLNSVVVEKQKYLKYNMAVIFQYKELADSLFFKMNLETGQIKDDFTDTIAKTIHLPITIGFESEVIDQFFLRGSLKQDFIVSETANQNPGLNTTSGAAGMGWHGEKMNIDAALQGLVGSNATQVINANSLLTKVSLTFFPERYF